MTIHYSNIPPKSAFPEPPPQVRVIDSRPPEPVLGMIVGRGRNITTPDSTLVYTNWYQYEWVKIRIEGGHHIVPYSPGSHRYEIEGYSDSYVIINPAIELNNRHVPAGTIVRLYPSMINRLPDIKVRTQEGKEDDLQLPDNFDPGVIYLFDAAQILVRIRVDKDLIPNELAEGTENLVNSHKLEAVLVDDPYSRPLEVVEVFHRDAYFDLKYDNENAKNKYFVYRGIIRQQTYGYAQPQPDAWTDANDVGQPEYEWLLVDVPAETDAYALVEDFISLNSTGSGILYWNTDPTKPGESISSSGKKIRIHNRPPCTRTLIKNEFIKIRWDQIGKVWQPVTDAPVMLELTQKLTKGGTAPAKFVWRTDTGNYVTTGAPDSFVEDALKIVPGVAYAGMRCWGRLREGAGVTGQYYHIQSIEPLCMTVTGKAKVSFAAEDEEVVLENISVIDGGFLKADWQQEITAANIFALSGEAGDWCEAKFDTGNEIWRLSQAKSTTGTATGRKIYLAGITGTGQVYIYELDETVYVANPCGLPMTTGDYCLVAKVDNLAYQWCLVQVVPQIFVGLFGEHHVWRKALSFHASDFDIWEEQGGGMRVVTKGVTADGLDRVNARRGLVIGGQQ